jgi:hypothetical protein
MTKLLPVIFLLVLSLNALFAQPDFPGLVEGAFGNDQELINGIQFSNHYSLVDGHPYYLDTHFREGSLTLNNERYEDRFIRYNLFSQRLEMEYRTPEGYLNQFMTVPELISSFTLGDRVFERMQPGDESVAYYQVISRGGTNCYIGWKKVMKLSRSDSSREYMFSAPMTTYWLNTAQGLQPFHNKKTFIALFPEAIQKEISRLLKRSKYSFRQPTVTEAESMISAALLLYERGELP